MKGIFLLNKPAGITSAHALKFVKRYFNADTAGHTGTLDPLATGMLPICIGEVVKFSQYILDADKAYRTTAKLGQITTTGDAKGDLMQELPVPQFTQAELLEILKQFTGEIQQVPSMYSALKHRGRPLYQWARKGVTIERAARTIEIKQLTLVEFTPTTMTLEVVCSKGTYIRNLVEDIGTALGCGAHVIELHRCYVAPFAEANMLTLEQLNQLTTAEKQARLLPIETALQHLPTTIMLTTAEGDRLQHGQRVHIVDPARQQYQPGILRFQTQDTDGKPCFIGLGEWKNPVVLQPRRMMKTIKDQSHDIPSILVDSNPTP